MGLVNFLLPSLTVTQNEIRWVLTILRWWIDMLILPICPSTRKEGALEKRKRNGEKCISIFLTNLDPNCLISPSDFSHICIWFIGWDCAAYCWGFLTQDNLGLGDQEVMGGLTPDRERENMKTMVLPTFLKPLTLCALMNHVKIIKIK